MNKYDQAVLKWQSFIEQLGALVSVPATDENYQELKAFFDGSTPDDAEWMVEDLREIEMGDFAPFALAIRIEAQNVVNAAK